MKIKVEFLLEGKVITERVVDASRVTHALVLAIEEEQKENNRDYAAWSLAEGEEIRMSCQKRGERLD